MKIFVNDIPVTLLAKSELEEWDEFHTIKKGDNKMISPLDLKGDILFVELTPNEIKVFLMLVHDGKFSKANSVTFAVDDYQKAKKLVKREFTIMKAAGGVVVKKKEILMIYRLNRWDLPKGKAEKKETMKETAKREVEEECNIDVQLQQRICATWHTYTRNKKRILKKTNWYLMNCVNDEKMEPQTDEGIEKVEWLTTERVTDKLHLTYPSIKHVFEKLNKKFHYTITIP